MPAPKPSAPPPRPPPVATSVVDLVAKLEALADAMGDSARMNMWLHKTVLRKLAENDGNIPKDLLD